MLRNIASKMFTNTAHIMLARNLLCHPSTSGVLRRGVPGGAEQQVPGRDQMARCCLLYQVQVCGESQHIAANQIMFDC